MKMPAAKIITARTDMDQMKVDTLELNAFRSTRNSRKCDVTRRTFKMRTTLQILTKRITTMPPPASTFRGCKIKASMLVVSTTMASQKLMGSARNLRPLSQSRPMSSTRYKLLNTYSKAIKQTSAVSSVLRESGSSEGSWLSHWSSTNMVSMLMMISRAARKSHVFLEMQRRGQEPVLLCSELVLPRVVGEIGTFTSNFSAITGSGTAAESLHCWSSGASMVTL
mmetsp:Transcript_91060/g.195257  ORF Transcript_91060/g.195257 Transcript_91060/m.195257 type:complete len:224 (+) Transcript_91060:798-1469(+)